MILTLNDHEEVELRGEPQQERFMVRYSRVYNIPYDLFTLVPNRGDAKADLISPLIKAASGVQIPRAMSVETRRQPRKQAMVQVVISWYQVRLFAGENTTSPSELNGSRETSETGYHRHASRYYVSAGGSTGIADGELYTGDSWGAYERLKVSETKDTNIFPGMFFHEVRYLGYKAYP